MKGIVKLDPPSMIVVAGHSTLRGVSMGTLTGGIAAAQGFLRDMLLLAMNVPRLDPRLFSLKRVNMVITNEPHLEVGKFQISVRKDYDCPTINYLSLELVPRGNYQTRAAFPTRSSRGSQYRRDWLCHPDVSRAGPWGLLPLLQ